MHYRFLLFSELIDGASHDFYKCVTVGFNVRPHEQLSPRGLFECVRLLTPERSVFQGCVKTCR
jgi:hypothetical protein